jgi:hypothetical protein
LYSASDGLATKTQSANNHTASALELALKGVGKGVALS